VAIPSLTYPPLEHSRNRENRVWKSCLRRAALSSGVVSAGRGQLRGKCRISMRLAIVVGLLHAVLTSQESLHRAAGTPSRTCGQIRAKQRFTRRVAPQPHTTCGRDGHTTCGRDGHTTCGRDGHTTCGRGAHTTSCGRSAHTTFSRTG